MEQKKYSVDRVSIERATYTANELAQSSVKRVESFQQDNKKEQRLAQGLCKACFYFRHPRIGGAAFTNRPCGICDEIQSYPLTATNVLCGPCAHANHLCAECGGDLSLKYRRKPRPYESQP